MTRSARGLLILILLSALALRLAWAFIQPVQLNRLPDQSEYLTLGQNLLHTGSLFFFDSRFQQKIYAYRMPGYPAFIAACGGSVITIRIIQSIIDTATIAAALFIANQLTGRVASATLFAICAAFLALNPFYIYFSGLILTETLFTALLTWSLLLLIQNRWLLFTLLLSAAAYLRPSGLILIPLLIVVAPSNNPNSITYRLRNAAIATAISLICLTPWAFRNHHLLGAYTLTTTNSGITAYDGFHSNATGASDQRFIAELPVLSSMNEVQRSNFFQQRAVDWIRKYPMDLPTLELKKILRGWSPIPLSAEFGKPIYRWISALYAVPFDLLCLLGLFSKRLTRQSKLLLTMPAIAVTILQLLSVGSIRYRMPAEAPLAVVAAAGASDLIKRVAKAE